MSFLPKLNCHLLVKTPKTLQLVSGRDVVHGGLGDHSVGIPQEEQVQPGHPGTKAEEQTGFSQGGGCFLVGILFCFFVPKTI